MTKDQALLLIEWLADHRAPALVAYANAHTLNLAHRSDDYRALLGKAALVMNDGAGAAIAARMQGRRFRANLNGSDLNPEILSLAVRRNWRVYLLGSAPGVAERAGKNLQSLIPGLQITGAHHGFLSDQDSDAVADRIRASGTDVLLVGMGNPYQEQWLSRHLPKTAARIGIAVGGFFDLHAGVILRPPRWMNALGMEWVGRLIQQPGRLWRRYLVGNVGFLARAGWHALRIRFRRSRNTELQRREAAAVRHLATRNPAA